MYWFQERCYKTLESAIAAYEEYKKNERILNGEGLAPLPCNLNLNKAQQMRLTRVWDKNELSRIKSYYGTLAYIESTNETYIGTPEGGWTPIRVIDDAVKDNKNIINCHNCGAPVKSFICEYCGTVY